VPCPPRLQPADSLVPPRTANGGVEAATLVLRSTNRPAVASVVTSYQTTTLRNIADGTTLASTSYLALGKLTGGPLRGEGVLLRATLTQEVQAMTLPCRWFPNRAAHPLLPGLRKDKTLFSQRLSQGISCRLVLAASSLMQERL
jgi:hypothetical protein